MGGRNKPNIVVAAGVLADEKGQVLIAQRPIGTHQAGCWEFPGGKLRSGETPRDGLVRELDEELGIAVRSAAELLTYEHEYSDRVVCLHVWLVTEYAGLPTGREGQPLRWVAIPELMNEGLLPADEPIIAALQPPA